MKPVVEINPEYKKVFKEIIENINKDLKTKFQNNETNI